MIGGIDIYISIPGTASTLDYAIRAIRLWWPHAVFENGETAEFFAQYSQLQFANLKEVLVYKTAPDFDRWRALGADPSLNGTMIHLLTSPRELALVIDDQPSHEMQAMIAAIKKGLLDNAPLLREAA